MPSPHRIATVFTRKSWVPYVGAAIDLDFVAQRYWWGGAEKRTGDFTTYVLNGSTFDANGLTASSTIDITLALAALGTFVPGAFAAAIYHTSAPAGVKAFFGLDDGTTTERVNLSQNVTTATLLLSVVDGNVAQSNINNAGSGTLGVRIGCASSYQTNDMKSSVNGTGATADSVGTMPTVTTLRIGKTTAASSNALGSIARVVAFTAVKTQAELNALSTALRDNVII